MFFFFFNDTATTEIYTLSLHDALPICTALRRGRVPAAGGAAAGRLAGAPAARAPVVHLGRSGHGGAGGRPGDAAAAAGRPRSLIRRTPWRPGRPGRRSGRRPGWGPTKRGRCCPGFPSADRE